MEKTKDEIYTLLTDYVADKCYDHDYEEFFYDEDTGEWVLWVDGHMDVAHYNPNTNKVY